MRTLLLNQFFHPDSAATSQLLSDLARQLADEGHEVTVICGATTYSAAAPTVSPAVNILRINPLPFRRSPLARLASYASFIFGAALKSVHSPAPDLILTLTTPPLTSVVGTLLKQLRGSRHFIWEMDLYPDIAVDLGVLHQRSFVTKLVGMIADYSRRKADGIIALGQDMKDRLLARGIPDNNIHVVHNWADGREIYPLPWPAPEPLNIHYSGNLGLAHDVATLHTVVLALGQDPRFRFIFAGGGPQRSKLEGFCAANRLHNAVFRPYCDRTDLCRHLADGHLGLVTQKPETVGSIVPSKVYGIMAAGRPILYIGPRRATPAQIIERWNCGWQIDPGDSTSLIALLKHLVDHPEEYRSAGEKARQAFLMHYDRPLGIGRITAILGLSQTQSQFAQVVPVAQSLPGTF